MNQQTKERNNVQKLDNVGSNPLLPAFSKESGDDSAKSSSSRIRRQRPGETKRENRKVSFCNYAVCVEVPSLLDVSDEEHSALWFSRDDFRSFRRSVKSKTVLVQQRYSRFQRDIEDVQDGILEYCQQEDEEKQKQKQLPSFHESSLKIRIGLRNWCRQHDFRGLEKWVSKELLEHREVARDGVSFVVALSKIVDDPVQLSERYQKLTRSHKAFARLLGEGDALTNDIHEQQQHHGILIPGGPRSSPTLAYHRKLNIDPTPRSRFSPVPSIAARINRQPR